MAENGTPPVEQGPAERDQFEQTETVIVERRPLWQRILKWLAILVVGLVALVLIVLFGINTDPGRRLVADQIGGYTTASGLNIKVGRIDGSIYGAMTLSDVRVSGLARVTSMPLGRWRTSRAARRGAAWV